MSIDEFYASIGVKSESVLLRLSNETLIKKYFAKMLKDSTFDNLCKAYAKKDYEEVFNSVHTLKGIAMNLEFRPLYEVCAELTELLRSGKTDTKAMDETFEKVKEAYALIIENIRLVL